MMLCFFIHTHKCFSHSHTTHTNTRINHASSRGFVSSLPRGSVSSPLFFISSSRKPRNESMSALRARSIPSSSFFELMEWQPTVSNSSWVIDLSQLSRPIRASCFFACVTVRALDTLVFLRSRSTVKLPNGTFLQVMRLPLTFTLSEIVSDIGFGNKSLEKWNKFPFITIFKPMVQAFPVQQIGKTCFQCNLLVTRVFSTIGNTYFQCGEE
jgi:hypothetical protein